MKQSRWSTAGCCSQRGVSATCAGAVLLGLAALSGNGALAQSAPVAQLQYSADLGANIAGVANYAARQDYVVDTLTGARFRLQIPGLPDSINLRDFQIDANGDLLFALDRGVTLSGIYFDPADVIAYIGGSFNKAFDATAAGVPRGVHCDGVARSGSNGALLLSFDKTFSVGATTVRPSDVIAFAGGSFGAKVLDAQALGLPANLNIDAIDSIASTTDLLVSFDSGGQVGGVVFADEDILQLHLADGSWSLRFALLGFSDRWGAANLDGLATAAHGDALFFNGFE